MDGKRSPPSRSISQLTSQPETIPSCYRRSRHAEFQPLSGRHPARLVALLTASPFGGVIETRFQQIHSALSVIVAAQPRSRLSVLDVGGANGALYFLMRPLFPHIDLDWTVFETPSVSAACARIDNVPIVFSDAIDPGRRFDALIMSGSIQYFPDPQGTCRRFFGQADWAIVSRLIARDAPNDELKVQFSPPDIDVPAWIFGNPLLRLLRELGETVLEWQSDHDSALAATVNACSRGLLMRTTS